MGAVMTRWVVLLGLGGVLLAFGWVKGAAHVQARWDMATAADAMRGAVIRQRQAEATVRVVTQYVDRIKVVREAGQSIVKEVPVYVPAEADAACVLNRGFVRLHDAAVHNMPTGSPGDSDGAASGIALSTATETITGNYQRCGETAERLKALQDWIGDQLGLVAGG